MSLRTYVRSLSLCLIQSSIFSQFYDNHIRDWPELALVAEHSDRRNNVSHLAKHVPRFTPQRC